MISLVGLLLRVQITPKLHFAMGYPSLVLNQNWGSLRVQVSPPKGRSVDGGTTGGMLHIWNA